MSKNTEFNPEQKSSCIARNDRSHDRVPEVLKPVLKWIRPEKLPDFECECGGGI